MIYVFVFAHPDDESMFFLPTIRSLIDGGKTVWLLCLTTGNYDRLGKIREKEMTEVGKMLGISKVIIRDNNDNMQDHPTERWNKTVNHDNQYVLITFDALGISGHVNHIDTYYGVSTAVETKEEKTQILEAWQLESEGNLVCKYIPVLSWILLMISFFNTKIITSTSTKDTPKNKNSIRVYRMHNPVLNWKAMAMHHSQFVWYRRLFVVFSCYTYYNKLTLISRIAAELRSNNTKSIKEK
ncbi:LmbE-like protein [Fragilariopsis cylindrus CCMP1102]|uniref:N-acetylglucosaminylphosphatidylinositol deacetylase n=1 Tax=Fragilariopsis cylindrus CCMP1102 TaxID=635003 RepID=A0A1E7ESD6_9STRA|nr:LmbE-like protein [Fragilariopsis cylindrus CCMP1102]|eukprot:OEU08792.1 LmbE-like protein [Fragilariopsis cylindrus CCMP1102]